MKNLYIFIISCCFFLSCIDDNVEESNSAIFDSLWQEFDQKYGGFIPRKVDWDSLYQVYAPLVSDDMDEAAFFGVCTQMLDILDDQHVFLQSTAELGLGFSSGKIGDELVAEEEFRLANVIDNYLEPDLFADNFGQDDVEYQFVYGILEGHNIGYIYLPHFEESSNNWHHQIDDAIVALSSADGMIVDVRNNGGGIPVADRYVARRFMKDEKYIFSVQTRNGPKHTDFDEATDYFSTPSENTYTKPIVALANKSTVSAGEEFLLFMQSQDHITVMGTETSNAFSGVSFDRFLPNGWRFGLPLQLYTYPDGSSPEGVGIIPDIYIKNDQVMVDNGKDLVLEEAIQMLK